MTSSTREEPGRSCVLSLGSIGVDFQMAVGEPPGIGKTVAASCFRRLVKQVPGAQTGVAMVTVMPGGEKGFVSREHANACWDESDAQDVIRAIRQAPGASVLVADCEIPVVVVEKAVREARNLGMKVVLDPSPADRVTTLLLSLADIVTPDAHEAEALTGIECKDVAAAVRAGRKLQQHGAATACIKLADGGCVVVESEGATHISSVPVDVVDTTGAGDAFAGALAVALSQGMSCIEAARAGVAASTVAVTRFGAQPSYPSREELESMLAKMTVTPVRGAPG